MPKDAATEPWLASGSLKREQVRQMFSDISSTYDFMNSAMSLRLHHRWRRQAAKQLQLRPGDKVVDVCTGTGDFVLPLRAHVGESGFVLGVDFCSPMLERARAKGILASWSIGDACSLPLRSGLVDGVTVGWGLRNVPDIAAALREIARVLKPGGRFVCLDMAVPQNPVLRTMSRLIFNHAIPALGALFGRRRAYTYLPKSTEKFATREELAKLMRQAGFTDVKWSNLFFGNICIHYGKK